jgi:hypothetical protein
VRRVSHVSHLPRRALLAGALGTGTVLATGGLVGCSPTQETTTPAGSVQPTAPAVDADSDLVESVGAMLATAWATATEIARTEPRVRRTARAFADLHAAHLDRLGVTADGAEPVPVEGAAGAALRGQEKGLRDRLVRAAVRAESGALAQVLASMAAAVDQRLVVTA